MHGIFVTGTDTGVGKTVASAALVAGLRSRMDVCYWKPLQTGIEEDDDTLTVRELAGCPDTEIYDQGIRLERALSPHLSAKLADSDISVGQILDFLSLRPGGKFWIVEGAGGVLVPLNEDELMIDLMSDLGMPAVIVARSGLGTINHTLLTVEALRTRKIEIAGVIMNGAPNRENRLAIEAFGRVKVLGEMPLFTEISSGTLSEWCTKNLYLDDIS